MLLMSVKIIGEVSDNVHSVSWAHDVILWGYPVQGQELDLMILVGPFHLCIVYDSMTVWLCLCICHALESTLSYLLVHFF